MNSISSRVNTLLESQNLIEFCAAFQKKFPAAHLYLVGGALRDCFLRRTVKDIDFLVDHLEPKHLVSWLEEQGSVDFVGKIFGVYKFRPAGQNVFIDIAFPRIDQPFSNTQGGYRDFTAVINNSVSVEMDLSRRDFTINAMAYNISIDHLLDPFNGQTDIEKKILRAVGDASTRFHEDLSRILRALRFACELDFSLEEKTWIAIREHIHKLTEKRFMKNSESSEWIVPRETIGKEFVRAFGANPPLALDLFLSSGALQVLIPECGELNKSEWDKIRGGFLAGEKNITAVITFLLTHIPLRNEHMISAVISSLKLTIFPRTHPLHIKKQEVKQLFRFYNLLQESARDSYWMAQVEHIYSSCPIEQVQSFLTMFLTGLSAEEQITIQGQIDTMTEKAKQVPLMNGNELQLLFPALPKNQTNECLLHIRAGQFEGRCRDRADLIDWIETRKDL